MMVAKFGKHFIKKNMEKKVYMKYQQEKLKSLMIILKLKIKKHQKIN